MPHDVLNQNDASFDTRLKFVDSVLREVFGLIPCETIPIAYDKDFPFPYNNFVYAVDTDPKASRTDVHVDQQLPGVHEIPYGLSTFVIRLTNSAAGYNDKNRVENEVAALSIARDALRTKLPHLVPRVFGWCSASNGQGWILQERMPGTPLLEDFDSMSDEAKGIILGQIADIVACFQRYQLPYTIREYGGLDFGPSGEYVSAPLSILDGGPFSSYEAFVRGIVQSKLAKADADPRVNGWRENNVRSRLDKFITHGLRSIMEDMNNCRKVLVHGDFSPDNLLYDKNTMQITAVLDFDFAHVATVADEFFRSLGHGIGRLPGSAESDSDKIALRKAMLEGFPNSLPPSSKEVQWMTARAWDNALRDRDVERPSTITNIAALSDLFWLSSEILPFKLCNEVVVGNSSPEQLVERRKDSESRLVKYLGEHGF